MQKKYIKLLLSLVITNELVGCSSTSVPVMNKLYYDKATESYAYCKSESCPQPTQFTIDNEEDHPPIYLEPPVIIKDEEVKGMVVNFAFNRYYLTTADIHKLSRKFDSLRGELGNTKVTIIGYTDNVEAVRKKSNANMKLALARAQVVKSFLIRKYNFVPANITTEAKPLCCYIASNKTRKGRFANRRAEIRIVINKIK